MSQDPSCGDEEELVQTKPVAEQVTPLVQREVESEEDEEKLSEDEMLEGVEVPEKEEEEEPIQFKTSSAQTPANTTSLTSRINTLKGSAQPLPGSVRAYFEPRFGHDFSQVKVHTDTHAAGTAKAVNARAFTVGRDVVFGAGQYMPNTTVGQQLLAHELTHVIQQTTLHLSSERSLPIRGQYQPEVIQRMDLGRGTPPDWRGFTLTTVPASDLARVQAAIDLIRNVVNDPKGYEECHKFFTDSCPGGTPDSMARTFSNAVIWKLTKPVGTYRARGDIHGPNIAYTQKGYDQGEEGLAGTLVHEMLHNCGISGGEEHYLAEVAKAYCMGPGRNVLSLTGGPAMGGGFPIFLLSYRRFLTEWASGHIQPMLGGDINVTGLTLEIVDREHELGGAEFGSAMFGLHGRTNLLWGGERFGGLTAKVETGLGVGRFTLRTPDATEVPSTAVAPGLVLQVGVGAEFYIPIAEGILPFSLEAAYRMVQPLNSEAERIHGLVFGLSARF